MKRERTSEILKTSWKAQSSYSGQFSLFLYTEFHLSSLCVITLLYSIARRVAYKLVVPQIFDSGPDGTKQI